MRWFIYEFITGGGLLADQCETDSTIESSLLSEGRAMLKGVAADFAALSDVEVTVLRDHRLESLGIAGLQEVVVRSAAEHDESFARMTSQCDGVLVIAPECDDALLNLVRQVEESGGKLLGPGSDFVEFAADKHRTAEFLHSHDIPAPRGVAIEPGINLADVRFPGEPQFPSVLKPRFGVGALGVQVLEEPSSFAATEPLRWETFHQGLAASVCVLSSQRESLILPAGEQHIVRSGDALKYAGGRIPLKPNLNERAQSLAQRISEVLPSPHGFWGMDLVLGKSPDGSDDVVIEINPRVTTSYVGLRALVQNNLAEVWLQLIRGEEIEPLQLRPGVVEFAPDGQVRCG